MAVMSVADLHVRLSGREILKGISLPEMRAGQMVGLIGPNASGKSTLLRAIAMGSGTQGGISLGGKPVTVMKRAERAANISLMPQTPPLGSTLTPFELLRSYARATNLGLSNAQLGDRMGELLGKLGLLPDAHRKLNELSGGKRQLVGMCLAMVNEPKYLLLDEPTSALDLRWQLTALSVARNYARSREAICVAALHDINLALRFCDLLVVLKDGCVAASGVPEEVIDSALLADVYGVSARLERCSQGAPVLIADAANEIGASA
ncbi:ABC transporter ATP-binding protein [Roseibium sp.]|uniref:ABC transporter ATP-binding protein n=1 Tax=Roseibium sp. TaxID=1936156 RepID=UPI003A96D981